MKLPKFTLLGKKRPRDLMALTLGKLERDVLETTWQLGEVNVHDVQRVLEQEKKLCYAYTTLQTTLDRLYKKEVLNRRKESRAFIYQSRFSREEFEQLLARDLIDGALGHTLSSVQPVLSYIVETVSGKDRRLLEELESLVQEKKAQLEQPH